MVQKRLGQLSDGEQAYLKLNKKGKIYGKVITNGAVTGRCTHHSPNLAQCVSSSSEYGKEFRSPYSILLPIWLCVVLILVVWSCVCWGITCIIMTMGIFQNTYLEDDIHTANQKLQDYPHVIKLKLSYMLSFILAEIKSSAKYLMSLTKKQKE